MATRIAVSIASRFRVRGGAMRHAVRTPALAVSILLLATAPAGASGAAGHGANTFSGSCVLSGQVRFSPSMTNTPRRIVQHATAIGTCSGSFTSRNGQTHQLHNAGVRYHATEYSKSATCNLETDMGQGSIAFAYGTIRFTISETRVSAIAAVSLKGAKGGSAKGQANVSSSANPVAIIQACGGAGLAKAPIQAHATTTPSISG